MARSGARLTHAEHLARHDGAYLGFVSTRAILKCFDRAEVPTITPYSWLLHAMTIINNVVPLKQGYM